MQSVYPGERKLKRRLMRQMWKEMIIKSIKKFMGQSTENNNEKSPEDEKNGPVINGHDRK